MVGLPVNVQSRMAARLAPVALLPLPRTILGVDLTTTVRPGRTARVGENLPIGQLG